jgi:hypothetical protein
VPSGTTAISSISASLHETGARRFSVSLIVPQAEPLAATGSRAIAVAVARSEVGTSHKWSALRSGFSLWSDRRQPRRRAPMSIALCRGSGPRPPTKSDQGDRRSKNHRSRDTRSPRIRYRSKPAASKSCCTVVCRLSHCPGRSRSFRNVARTGKGISGFGDGTLVEGSKPLPVLARPSQPHPQVQRAAVLPVGPTSWCSAP